MTRIDVTTRRWRAVGSCAAAGLIAAATVGAVDAASAWRHARDDRATQFATREVRAAAGRERRALVGVERGRPVGAFFSTASDETRELNVAIAHASGRRRSSLQRAASLHDQAVRAVALAVAPGTTPSVRARLEIASLRLHDAARNETALAEPSGVAPAPWPATTVSRVGGSALLLTALVGLAFLVRAALRLVRRPEPAEEQTELDRLHDALRTDSLTGLHNHRAFHDDLMHEIQRRNTSGSTFSLLALDLDGLKRVNDLRGHQAGDEYIRRVANCLRTEVGQHGRVYRTGGDEFMAIFPNRRAWHALSLAHNIQRAATSVVGRRALSVGVTESTNTESARLLVHQADLALYEAKRHKLLAVTYHPGLEPARSADAEATGPTPQQKTLAAALARAVDAKDVGTRNHSETVAELSVGIAAQLGVAASDLDRLRLAGLLHDVGKIGVPDAVLGKSASLAADERAELENHVSVGHAILIAADLHHEAGWVLHHHERVDGEGYPARLRGEQIPLESRIIAVADAFEAMTGRRPYRTCLSYDEALAELRRHSGTQFDPRCVDAIVARLGATGERGRDAAAV
jgi:diguanylate cyclase (GGDEF)-like protein